MGVALIGYSLQVEEEEEAERFDENYLNDSDPSVLRFLIASREVVSSKQVWRFPKTGSRNPG